MNDFITVRTLLKENKERLSLKLLCSINGLNRKIVTGELHRPGLALAGYTKTFTYNRVQILGNTEISYLNGLTEKRLISSINKFLEYDLPVIILTSEYDAPSYLIQAATRRNIPVISTTIKTTSFSHLITGYLQRIFAQKISIHGSMVDVYGVGMLFKGRSGIGKSEIAMDLVERGHRLVADDLVMISKSSEQSLISTGVEHSDHMMEIRGIGLVDVKRMFGVRSVRKRKKVEVVVKLEVWDEDNQYERTGLDEQKTTILGVEIPQVILPINPGKNITVISEAIAMDQLLKSYGYNTPQQFNEKLIKRMKTKHASPLSGDIDDKENDINE